MAKYLAYTLFLLITIHVSAGVTFDNSFFDVDETHDVQTPIRRADHGSERRVIQGQSFKSLERLLTTMKDQTSLFYRFSKSELQGIREMLLEDKYKPWGAASIPITDHTVQVIIDNIDDELFTPNSERHSYDERSHEEARYRING